MLFVALLNAELADVLGSFVVGEVFVFPVFHRRFFGLVDTADVAEHMARDLAVRVVAEKAGLDFDARKAIALRCETRHFFIAQAGANRHRIETARVFSQALEAAAVAWRDVDHLGQAIDRRVDIDGLGRRDLQRVGRVVRRQDDAVAVQDEAAVRHHRHHGRSVVFGLLGQVFVPHHLQVREPHAQQPKGHQHRDSGDDDAALEARDLGSDVAYFGHWANKLRRVATSGQIEGRPNRRERCSQRTVGVGLGRTTLGRQQQHARQRPEQSFDNRRHQQVPAGKHAAADHANCQFDDVRQREEWQHLQRL